MDNLTTWVQTTPYAQRQQQYQNLGLSSTLGDFRGTPEQNQALFAKTAPASLLSAEQLSARSGVPVPSLQDKGIQTTPTQATEIQQTLQGPSATSTKDIISATTPTTLPSSIYDLTKQTAAQETRGAEALKAGIASSERTANYGISELGKQGTDAQKALAENAAGFGGSWSGKTVKSQAEVAQETAKQQEQIRANLGDNIYGQLSDFERNYGTKLLSSLNITQAQDFLKLPVEIRGVVEQQYEKAITDAEDKAQTSALKTLESMGYTMLPDGTLAPTLERQRFEAQQAQPDTTAGITEYNYAVSQGYTGSFTDYQTLKATQFGTENKSLTGDSKALVFDNTSRTAAQELTANTGADGFYDPNIYMKWRNVIASTAPTYLDDFDKKFASKLNPVDAQRLGISQSDIDPFQRIVDQALKNG